MFGRTQGRGSRDTPSAAGPAGSVIAAARRLDPARRVAVLCWLVAILVHLPALPIPLVGWLDLLLDRTPPVLDDEPVDADSFIPIELDLEGLEAPGAPGGAGDGSAAPSGETEGDVLDAVPIASASAPPIASSAPPPPPPLPPPPPPPPGGAGDGGVDDPYADDAGLPDAGGADAGPSDAGVPDAGVADAGSTSELPDAGVPDAADVDAGPPDAGPPDAGALDAGLPPVASAGPDAGAPPSGAGTQQDPDDVTKVTKGLTAAPNVQVLLVGKTLRGHPVGKEMGKLLSGIPEWRGFFEGTGIDPVADLEHMQITGPELRNSANVVSILEFSSSGDQIRKAVDVVVKRTKGEWLTGKAFPTARVEADRAKRLLVILPSRRTLAVLPGKDDAKIDSLARLPAYPSNLPFAIQISMVTPHRAFRSVEKLRIPESILKMRLRAYPHGVGGGKVELEFLDASPEKAAEHAPLLDAQWAVLQTAALLTTMMSLDDMTFRAEGSSIVGSATFTQAQLEKILALATRTFVTERTKGGTKGGPRKGTKDGKAPTRGPGAP